MDYDELEEYLDMNWINDIREEEKEYDKFYIDKLSSVNVIFVLVNDGKIYDVKTRRLKLDKESKLSWLCLLENMNDFLCKGYIVSNILKYSLIAEPEDVLSGDINNKLKSNVVESSSDIFFEPTVRFFHDISCVCCIMEKKSLPNKNNNTTRRVYVELGKGKGNVCNKSKINKGTRKRFFK